MRPTERIDNFLAKVDWDKLFDGWGLTVEDIKRVQESSIIGNRKLIENYWKDNPDQRIGQVLINLGLISRTQENETNIYKFTSCHIWWNEESDILIDQGIAPEECLYWTSHYDKDMNLIPSVNRLIKDLDTDHINNIYIHLFKHNRKLSDKYRKAFRNVLNKRNECTNAIDFIEQLWDMKVIGE